MLLRKNLPLSDVSLKLEGDTGRFSGYASVFGGVDSHGDTILKGAFVDSLKGAMPKMFFNHEWRLPIGKYMTAKEDNHGLFVEGELTPGMTQSADIGAAMKHGTLDGLSIGGFVRKGDYEETSTGRVLRRWTVLLEISPVAFPSDDNARIDLASVKGTDFDEAIAEMETIRDFERLLRDAGGFSKGAATALVARAKVVFAQGEPAEEIDAKASKELQDRLERFGIPV